MAWEKRHDILNEIYENSENNRIHGRLSEGYDYSIKQGALDEPDILVMGDKVWNPATLLLHGDYSLLPRLECLLGVQIKLIHAIRNPFDVIATMHFRSKAPIPDRIRWYFMHCDAACAIYDHCQDTHYINVYHEKLVSSPDTTITEICTFIEADAHVYPIEATKSVLFDKPKQTRFNLAWDKKDIEEVVSRMSRYDFLQKYAAEDYSGLSASA